MTEAGRELDARVAREVMGWHSVWVRGYFIEHFTGGHYSDPESCARACGDEMRPVHLWAADDQSTFGKGEENWQPSVDIAAAWEVVEALNKRSWRMGVETQSLTLYRAWATFGGMAAGKRQTFYEAADSPALAICLAALAAMEAQP